MYCKRATLPRVMAGQNEKDAGFVQELLRRGVSLGFTGFMLTEETLRKLGAELPREAVEALLTQSEKMRAEFLDRIAREFTRAAGNIDPAQFAAKVLEGRTLEVTARFRLLPKDAGEQ